jgi:poly-gamma-glutamate capsule biosynthesis protein CapA/YwtB (metallophosphatase superfamily)
MEAPVEPRSVTRRAVLGGLATGALGAVAACTSSPSSSSPSNSPSVVATTDGLAAAPSATSATTATTTGPRLPLVLAVRTSRSAGLTASRAVLDAGIAGGRVAWSDVGGTGDNLYLVRGASAGGASPDADAVTAVEANGDTLAVVRADALGPAVAAVPVEGVDPVTRPDAYPVSVPGDPANPVDPSRIVTTLWVGDVMLGRRVGQQIAAARDPNLPFSGTADRLRAADLTVGNLECTLSRNGRPTQGGDSFGAEASSLTGLRDAGFDVLVLANNHLGDYGDQALRETLTAVRGGGFTLTGAGEDLAAALEPAVVERKGVRFGVVAFNAIGETPAATPASAGALSVRMPPRTGPLNEGDLARVTDAVQGLSARADVVVVYPHWGTQYVHEPVPEQRDVGRRLVEAGATAVIGSHPHWVQGLDLHQGRLVAHSLGNFVFDMTFSTPVQQGVALELVFWGSRPMAARLLPYRIGDRYVPRWIHRGVEFDRILADVWGASTGPFAA